MAQDITFDVDGAILRQAELELHINYGVAMDAWSGLERAMFDWFCYLTRVQRPIANAIFWSNRGFYARTEMLEAIVEIAPPKQEIETRFIKEALKKARQYSAYRNRL